LAERCNPHTALRVDATSSEGSAENSYAPAAPNNLADIIITGVRTPPPSEPQPYEVIMPERDSDPASESYYAPFIGYDAVWSWEEIYN